MTAHAFWAGPLLALLAFAEGLAVVGSFVPGSIILFTIGTSAGAAHLNVTSMVVWATVGAWLGDTLSYWLGKRHGSRMLAMRPFAYKPQWTERARSLLERRGDIAVIVRALGAAPARADSAAGRHVASGIGALRAGRPFRLRGMGRGAPGQWRPARPLDDRRRCAANPVGSLHPLTRRPSGRTHSKGPSQDICGGPWCSP